MSTLLKKFKAELHIHTVLSPCADIKMIPPLIIQEAQIKNINIIAVTDHNASANIQAVQKAAEGSGITVLPGMELQTKEEIHCLCLFDALEQIVDFQYYVDIEMPPIKNNIEYFGEQFVVDETGSFIRRENKLLITSANITLKSAWEKVKHSGGMLIPAHIDRKAFSLITVLGFVPPDIRFDALEISKHTNPEAIVKQYPDLVEYPLIQNGDVHFQGDMLGANEFFLEEPTIAEIRLAFEKSQGRYHKLILN